MPILSVVWKLFPLVFIFFAYACFIWLGLDFISPGLLKSLPYLLGVSVLGFALMFNRWRFVAPIVIAMLCYAFIQSKLQTPISQPHIASMFIGLNSLFCLSLLVSALLPEKGAFTRVGVCYFVFAIIAPATILFLDFPDLEWASFVSLLELTAFSFPSENLWFTNGLYSLHLLSGFVLLALLLYRRQTSDEAAFICWVTGLVVFLDFSRSDISAVLFSALFISLFLLFQRSNYEVTYKDALTGISGRRALDDYLTTLGKQYSIAMMDVDHFKKFNDTHGHDVGDQVLRMVASKISKVEGGGKAFRYGGEEFTVVFNRRDARDIKVYLEAVRESIQHYEMTIRSNERLKNKKEGKQLRGKSPINNKTVSVTISIGIANSEAGLKPSDVIKKADTLLYKAKETGRNCTVCE